MRAPPHDRFFSNMLPARQLTNIADALEHEVLASPPGGYMRVWSPLTFTAIVSSLTIFIGTTSLRLSIRSGLNLFTFGNVTDNGLIFDFPVIQPGESIVAIRTAGTQPVRVTLFYVDIPIPLDVIFLRTLLTTVPQTILAAPSDPNLQRTLPQATIPSVRTSTVYNMDMVQHSFLLLNDGVRLFTTGLTNANAGSSGFPEAVLGLGSAQTPYGNFQVAVGEAIVTQSPVFLGYSCLTPLQRGTQDPPSMGSLIDAVTGITYGIQ
jgi:hypothetical protein